jgi:MFS family permease
VIRRIAASVPLAVVLLNVTAVAVLLPDIRLDLGSSSSGAQWALNAYLLALAALFPLLCRWRTRALTVTGVLAMAAGAIVSASADSTAVLVAGLALQGAGAAAVLAPIPGSRVALALPGAALALGPLVGGLLAEQNWWHVFFWATVPLAALAGAGSLATLRRPGDRETTRALTFAAGMTALTVAWVQSEVWSWGWWALLALVGAVFLRQARVHEVRGATLAWAALAGCLATLVFLLPEYFQLARNLSGSRSGVLLLAVTLAAVGGWTATTLFGRLIPWTGRLLAGAVCLVGGLAVLATIDAHARWAVLIGALGLTGLGLGVSAAAARGLPGPTSAPLAAVLAGAGLGLAAGGAAFQFAQADERESGATFEEALAAGVGWAALALLLLLAFAALMIWRLERRPTPASSEARPAAGS